jgi:putative spermidine/putrescine transport system permease protein
MLSPFGIAGPGFAVITVVLHIAVSVYTAIRQLPTNLFDAYADLGAGAWRTIRTVVLPLIRPAIIAGSVFTFSLSLGDYLVAKFVGGDTQMIGSVIASNINLNPPLAAAFSVVPIAFVVIYLVGVQRTGALERM